MQENFESPASIITWSDSSGVDIYYTKLFNGDSFLEEYNLIFL